MNPGDSQIADWSRGGHTVPGGLDDLGRKVPRLNVFDPAFQATQPAPMDAGQLRRDSIAAASQAPRIPRSTRRQADPHCTGECRQGRDRCAAPKACLLPRMEPAGDDPVLSLVWLLCLSVILCLGAALWFRVEWSDVISWLAMIGGAL